MNTQVFNKATLNVKTFDPATEKTETLNVQNLIDNAQPEAVVKVANALAGLMADSLSEVTATYVYAYI
ncbi:hypothetical protein AWM75_07870 [Aerococcus urinaehominis]|uniref:DUF1659 domain-containing protein n=1 Tax=Aerococcus urinaehominis TaxID=128944 RepID=A0A0X8FMN7_9LACT|nr:hypothetical protein [Aerococcus urinaehominis]AMB99889.1 hypothetical protein AWM75_07870 [Aerococcus urinaehominis]SDM52948.1 hypothetical protein SAMN04487985_12124 [Aerococcus urinaehominis]